MQSLVLTTPGMLTAPLPGTPKLRITGEDVPLTSDTFTGANATTLAGRMTDAALGGVSLPWNSVIPTSHGIAGGRLVPGSAASGSYFSYLTAPPEAGKEIMIELRVSALPVGNVVYIDVARDADASGTSKKLRAQINQSGAVTLSASDGFNNTALSGPALTVAPGDTLGIKYNAATGVAKSYRNGALHATYTGVPLYTGRKFGLAGTSAAANTFSFDDCRLIETII